MMKRVFLSFFLSLLTLTSFAQMNIYARMFGIVNGQVKTIVMETTGEVFNFDKEGKLLSYTMGTSEIRYSWKGNKVTLAAYQDGNKMGEEYITVTKNTATEIAISLPNGTVTETYRAVGGEAKATTTSNGVSMVETAFYRSESDKYPYKYTISLQGQTETLEISGYQYDSHGNWIRQTIKSNGESQTDIRTITYYN